VSDEFKKGTKDNKDSDYWFNKAILGSMDNEEDTANLNRYKECLRRNLNHYPAMYNVA